MSTSGDEKTIRVVVDRWEADVAVLETEGGEIINAPRGLLPEGVSEGQVLEIRIRPDPGTRKLRAKRVKDLQKRLRERESSQ